MDVNDLVIEVRDGNLVRKGQITPDYWVDVMINPKFNDVGTWSITLPAEHPRLADLNAPSAGVIFTFPGFVVSGFMVDAINNADTDDPQSTWTFSGVTDEIILDDPLLYPTPGEADPALQINQFNTRTGARETLMYEYLVANIGTAAPVARRNPYLSIGVDGARGGSTTYSAAWDVMLEAFQVLAKTGGLGFKVTQVGANLKFEAYVPTDRTDTIILDMYNRTVQSTEYGYGSPKLTHAIVGGQGDGPYRLIKERTSADSLAAATAWKRRRERFVDARSAETDTELNLAGDDALADGGSTLTSVAVVPMNDSTMRFGIDWFLGDKVKAVVGTQQVSTVVTEAVITADATGIQVAVKIGDTAGYDFEAILTQQVQGMEERLRDMERLVSTDPLLVRSRIGTVATDYTEGLLDVQFDGDVTYTSGIRWAAPYVPTAGDTVSLQYSDGEWIVTGSVRSNVTYLRRIELVPQGGTIIYDSPRAPAGQIQYTSPSQSYSPTYVTKSATGWVVCEGLLGCTGTIAAGTTIATLPVGFRPLNRSRFTIMGSGNATFRVDVYTDGTIRLVDAIGAGYISLNQIIFNNDFTYNAMTLISPWVANTSGTYGVPGYAKDTYGLVGFQGAISGGTTNTQAWAEPAGFLTNAGEEFHMLSGSLGGVFGYGNIGHATSAPNPNTLKPRNFTTGLTLHGLRYFAAANTHDWKTPQMLNSWVHYGAGYPTPQFAKRPDGIVVLKGLIRSGTVGAICFILPEGYRPDHRLLLVNVTNDVTAGRVDIESNGQVSIQTGSNNWFSLDGLMFVAQQ